MLEKLIYNVTNNFNYIPNVTNDESAYSKNFRGKFFSIATLEVVNSFCKVLPIVGNEEIS